MIRAAYCVFFIFAFVPSVAVAGLSYWAFGYGFAYGKGYGFIGGSGFFGNISHSELPKWLFQMVFAANAATIVSGGMAERCEFLAYLGYSIILTGWYCNESND